LPNERRKLRGGLKFTKFLSDVERTSRVSTRPSALPSCHPLWNASVKNEGTSPISADLEPKSVAMATSVERSRNKYKIEHLQPRVCQSWKFGIGLLGSEISLLQAIIKKKKVTAVEHKLARPASSPAS